MSKNSYFNSNASADHYSYAFGVSFAGEGKAWKQSVVPHSQIRGFGWSTNDIVTVTVDFEKKTIEFKQNDKIVGNIVDIKTDFGKMPDVKYRIAASAWHKGTKYRILSYEAW